MRIESDVLDVLKRLEVDGAAVKIGMPLERKLYLRVDKVLQALGGKWNTKAKTHLFETDPAERLDLAVLTSSVDLPKDEFNFFPTPALLAQRVAAIADIKEGMTVLEPSAGMGSLVTAILFYTGKVAAVELMERNCDVLRQSARQMRSSCMDSPQDEVVVLQGDFLKFEPEGTQFTPLGLFDRVVMNPPFMNLSDVNHVRHAFRFLKPGGVLVSIMAPGWTFRQDRKCQEFRAFVAENHGFVEKLPEESFKSSGTSVNTVVVRLEKPWKM